MKDQINQHSEMRLTVTYGNAFFCSCGVFPFSNSGGGLIGVWPRPTPMNEGLQQSIILRPASCPSKKETPVPVSRTGITIYAK